MDSTLHQPLNGSENSKKKHRHKSEQQQQYLYDSSSCQSAQEGTSNHSYSQEQLNINKCSEQQSNTIFCSEEQNNFNQKQEYAKNQITDNVGLLLFNQASSSDSQEITKNTRAFKDILDQSELEITRNVSKALSDSDYFKQDSTDYDEIYNNLTSGKCCKIKVSGNSSSYASWSWRQFFEFFFYHLIFFIFGPFCIIIFYPFNRLYLYRNLGFNLGGDFSIFQTVLWFLNLTFTVSYFTINSSEHFELFQLYNNWIMLVFRIFSISCKYAMLHPIQVQFYRMRFLTKEEKRKDFYLEDWKKQVNTCIIEELHSSAKRNEIDLGLFTCHFFQETNSKEQRGELENLRLQQVSYQKAMINKGAGDKIVISSIKENRSKDINQIESSESEQKNQEDQEEIQATTDEHSYNGMIILHHLINQFNKIYKFYNSPAIPLLLAFFRSIIWVVFYCIYNPEIFLQLQWYELIVGSEMIIFNFFLYYVCANFLITQLSDVHRIYYLNIQMLFLTKPRKDENFISYKKVLPTLNLTCSNSFKNWIQMRRLSSEYGKKYWLRGQANTSFMLLYSFYPIIFIFLHLLDIFTFCQLNLWYLVYDFAAISTVVGISLYYTASINNQFTYHAQVLDSIRIIFRNLLRDDVLLLQKDEFCSYLYRTILRKLRQQNSNNREAILKNIKSIIQSIDDVKNELILQQNTEPFECFGITITFTRLKNAMLFLSSLLAFAINVYVRTHGENK